jgi:glycolate oxidase
VVGATLRTRHVDKDVPFGVVFEDLENLARTTAGIRASSVPLWHLAFVNPGMSHARGLGKDYLLFGAYPGKRAADVAEGLREALGPRGGRMLPTTDAYRVWGERFFPVAPSNPTPTPERKLIPLTELVEILGGIRDSPEENAVQGTVSRSGEVLLLTFDAREEGWVQDHGKIRHERGI